MFTNSTSPFGNISPIVKNLLVFNLIGFVGSMIFDQANRLFGVYYPDSSMFHWWQVITYMFMHSGFAHLFFNRLALLMFGPIIEPALGRQRVVRFSLITGLGPL